MQEGRWVNGIFCCNTWHLEEIYKEKDQNAGFSLVWILVGADPTVPVFPPVAVEAQHLVARGEVFSDQPQVEIPRSFLLSRDLFSMGSSVFVDVIDGEAFVVLFPTAGTLAASIGVEDLELPLKVGKTRDAFCLGPVPTNVCLLFQITVGTVAEMA